MSEKPIPPSKKRLAKAKRDGKILKSSLLTDSLMLCSVITAGYFVLHAGLVRLQMLLQYWLLRGLENPLSVLVEAGNICFALIVPLLILGGVVGILCTFFQTGPICEPSLLAFKGDRLSPVSGFRKMFSGFKEVPRVLITVVILTLVLIGFSISVLPKVVLLLPSGSPYSFKILESQTLIMLVMFGTALASLGIWDYIKKRKQFFNELGMTLDEARREIREDEGDPHIKSLRKAMHGQLSREELIAKVRKAKVVIIERGA